MQDFSLSDSNPTNSENTQELPQLRIQWPTLSKRSDCPVLLRVAIADKPKREVRYEHLDTPIAFSGA